MYAITGGSITGLVKPRWNAGYFQQYWFDVTTCSGTWRSLTPTSGYLVTGQDIIYQRTFSQTDLTDYNWRYYIPVGHTVTGTIIRSSSNSGVIVPSSSDPSLWSYVSSGSGTLTISSAERTVNQPVQISGRGGTYVDVFTGYVSNSLRKHLIDSVDTRISGKTAADGLPIFSLQDHTNSNYVRNTGCWAYGVDLTPLSPWNSDGGVTRAGTLVSPKHLIFATHYQIATGATVRFITSGNQVINRTMTGKASLTGYSPYYPDITVGALDSDVPTGATGISFARVLPNAFTGKLPGSLAKIPVIRLDQEEKALVGDLTSITSGAGFYGATVVCAVPTDSQRLLFYENLIGGDSSNPCCMIVSGKLVLLNVWTFGGAGQGTSLTYYKSQINTIMSGLGGNYALTDVDLGGFPSY